MNQERHRTKNLWKDDVEDFKSSAHSWLLLYISEFNEAIPKGTKIKFMWGYNHQTGLKEIRVATYAETDDAPLSKFESICEKLTQQYNSWVEDYGCEAAFFFVKNEEGWFEKVGVSAINMNIFSSQECYDENAKMLIDAAKEEHKVS